MEKTTTLNLRVNPAVKKSAEEILSRLGLSMSTAIDIYLRQISLTGSIPFPVSLPMAPPELNMDFMSKEEIMAKLNEGYKDVEKGNYRSAEEVFAEFLENH